jgi:hypothetical protein
MPAQAGIQSVELQMDSGFRGNDAALVVMPAQAGIQCGEYR